MHTCKQHCIIPGTCKFTGVYNFVNKEHNFVNKEQSTLLLVLRGGEISATSVFTIQKSVTWTDFSGSFH